MPRAELSDLFASEVQALFAADGYAALDDAIRLYHPHFITSRRWFMSALDGIKEHEYEQLASTCPSHYRRHSEQSA